MQFQLGIHSFKHSKQGQNFLCYVTTTIKKVMMKAKDGGLRGNTFWGEKKFSWSGQYIVVVQFVVKQKVTRFKMAMLLKFKG